MPSKFSKSKTILFSIITTLAILTIINFVCGLIVQNRYIALDSPSPKDFKHLFGYFAPNQEKIILFPGLRDYKVTTNALGFRITSPLKQEPKSLDEIKDKLKILCLGDSETFGNHVSDEDTYPYQLQKLISRDGRNAVVLNAGIGSASMPDYLDYLKIKGLELKPNIIILQFFDNDLVSLIDWKKSKYQDFVFEKGKFSLSREIKLMNILRVFRKMELDNRYKRWIKKTDDPKAREILRSDSKNIEDNCYLSAFRFKETNTDPLSPKLKPLWERYFKDLTEIQSLLKERNIKLLFVIYPSICTLFDYGKNNYQEVLIPYLKRAGIPFVDMRKRLLPERNEFLKLYTDLPRDFHLSPYSKKIMADEVYRLIFQGQK